MSINESRIITQLEGGGAKRNIKKHIKRIRGKDRAIPSPDGKISMPGTWPLLIPLSPPGFIANQAGSPEDWDV